LAIPCEDPTGVTHSNVTHNSATITWTAGGTETNWKVEWQLESTTTWYSATTTEAMYALINLIANSCYNVRVKAVCNPGDESDWSAVDNFCTPQIPCDAPTNVVTTNITDHTITVAWTPNGTEDSWKIFYRVAGENAAQIGPITAPTYTLTDLTDSTEYEICVLSVCQSVQSDSTCILATTLDAVGISTITMANNLQLYPNPTTGELRIKNYELREGDKIEIYNMLGQKQQLSTNNYPLNTIDVSHLSAGMYTLKIGGYVGKFVKKY
jgi:predicted phage tail protein